MTMPMPARAPEPMSSGVTPRRSMLLGLRGKVGGLATPGVSPIAPQGVANPLQSIQFGSASPANSMSHDNPLSAASPNSPASAGLGGSAVA
jgi:hypothetical protein